MSIQLWEWWEERLTRSQRDQLMGIGRGSLPPDLAHEVQGAAGSLVVVEQRRAATGSAWHLSAQTVRFVGDREYERRHPGQDAPPARITVYSMTPALPATVELLYTESCPNWEATAIRLSIALQATGREDLPVHLRQINTPDEAEQEQFTGSPMIRFDGVDPLDAPGLAVGLSCRVYPDAEGAVGGPTVAQLIDALLAFERLPTPGGLVDPDPEWPTLNSHA